MSQKVAAAPEVQEPRKLNLGVIMAFEVKATGERSKLPYESPEETAFFSRNRPTLKAVDPKAVNRPYGRIVVRNKS